MNTPVDVSVGRAWPARSFVARWNLCCLLAACFVAPSHAQLIQVERIWDRAPHNAFTDLARYKGEWFCVFREGQAHVSPDGALRVIRSRGGRAWTSAALLTWTNGDLRDAKLSLTAAGELMLSGAVALPQPGPVRHRSLAWFSRDGRSWSAPVEIGDTNFWLWRTTWDQRVAYSIGYETTVESFVRLYTSSDGRRFTSLVPRLFDHGAPNESSLVFLRDHTAMCLLRRDGPPNSGLLGSARPPYTTWEWKDLGVRIGGPHMLRLPDSRLVAAVRLYDGAVRTSLAWVDPTRGQLTEFLKLPSGGDTSYAGLIYYRGLLWVSYYSSHEGKANIYLARVRVPH
jgi:hypothetical protein